MTRIIPQLIIILLSTATCFAKFSRLDLSWQKEAIKLMQKDTGIEGPRKEVAEFLISTFNGEVADTNKLYAIALDQSVEYRYRATAIKFYFKECNFDTKVLERILQSRDEAEEHLGVTLLCSLNPNEENYRLLCMVMDGGGPFAPSFRYPFSVATACATYLCTTGEYQRVVFERLRLKEDWGCEFRRRLFIIVGEFEKIDGSLPGFAVEARLECILRETDYGPLSMMLSKETPRLRNTLKAKRQKLEQLLELVREKEEELDEIKGSVLNGT